MFDQKKSFVSTVAGASIILALISIFSKGIGFFREVLYASAFGLNKEFDLFLVSAAIPFTINTAVIYIGQHYFIPAYHKFKKESEIKAKNFFNSSFYLFIIGGILLSVILGLLSNEILNIFINQKTGEVKDLAVNLFLLFLITIPLNAGVSVLSSYLQSEYHFALPAFAQLLVNLTIILMVILLSSSINIYVLPLSFIIGNLIALLLLIIYLAKDLRLTDFHFVKSFKIDHADTLITLIIIEFISLSYPIIDRYFYAQIPSGGIAALNYALTIYTMPVSIFTMALITAIFPKFSEQANENKTELISALKKGININIFIIAPMAAILIFNGYDLIKIFYERGQFNASDTKMTELVLIYYSLSLVFYSTYLLAIKLLYSLSMHIWVLILSLTGFAVKIILNFLMVGNFYQNGLALATSIVFILLFIVSFSVSGIKLNVNLNMFNFKRILFAMINVIISYLVSVLFTNLVAIPGLISFFLEIVIFTSVYILNSYFTSEEDLMMALDIIKKYLPFNFSRSELGDL